MWIVSGNPSLWHLFFLSWGIVDFVGVCFAEQISSHHGFKPTASQPCCPWNNKSDKPICVHWKCKPIHNSLWSKFGFIPNSIEQLDFWRNEPPFPQTVQEVNHIDSLFRSLIQSSKAPQTIERNADQMQNRRGEDGQRVGNTQVFLQVKSWAHEHTRFWVKYASKRNLWLKCVEFEDVQRKVVYEKIEGQKGVLWAWKRV